MRLLNTVAETRTAMLNLPCSSGSPGALPSPACRVNFCNGTAPPTSLYRCWRTPSTSCRQCSGPT